MRAPFYGFLSKINSMRYSAAYGYTRITKRTFTLPDTVASIFMKY